MLGKMVITIQTHPWLLVNLVLPIGIMWLGFKTYAKLRRRYRRRRPIEIARAKTAFVGAEPLPYVEDFELNPHIADVES